MGRAGAWTCMAVAAAMGCGGEDPVATLPGFAEVTFEYRAPTATDPAVARDFPGCVEGVGRTHIHPSWRGFEGILFSAEGPDLWRITFSDVAVGVRHSLRVSDPNACRIHRTGASTENVFANGVLLSEIVDTPGSGLEPGLAFTVAADGTVTP